MRLALAFVWLLLVDVTRANSGSPPVSARESAKQQDIAARTLHVSRNLTVKLGTASPLKFVLIPAGTFMMGSPAAETSGKQLGPRSNEWPQHKVTITRPFYLSVYKITQDQFEAVMGTNPSRFPDRRNPVDAVTWEDAAAFCLKTSAETAKPVRLPTEAEREYAARAGTTTAYSFGDDENLLAEYSWFHDNATGKTHPVGLKKPNAWGLFDVHGLLWEYCSDYYTESYEASISVDPTGPATGTAHTARGGTFGSRPIFVRSAIRSRSPDAGATKEALSRFGFRVAMALPASPSRDLAR